MTNKEALFFIGKSLTILYETDNRNSIEDLLKKQSVNWELIVQISTTHYVFPALYINFLRADFLKYLPNDLVNYMAYITDLNRERNKQILDQAKDIHDLLIKNEIKPIFLKGTGNLLEGLYADIGERMIGDIDFLVDKKDYQKTIHLFEEIGFTTVVKDKYHFPEFKHYPRLYKDDIKNIAGIEIHKDLISEKYANEFNYEIISKDVQYLNNIYVLSYANQLNLSIIAKQINDFGVYYKNISLRNAYDVFLLSKKTNAKKSIAIFQKIKEPLNCFLALCFEVMGKAPSLTYNDTKKAISYISIFYKNLNNQRVNNNHFKKASIRVFLLERFDFIKHSIYNREYRKWMLKRMSDKNWRQKRLKQIVLKITKNK